MDVDDILNESDDSSTPEEGESSSEASNQNKDTFPEGNDQEQENEADEQREEEEVKAPFALEGKDFPAAASEEPQDSMSQLALERRRSSDLASQEDDKAYERKEDMVGLRRGLKTMAATFAAAKPSSSLIETEMQEQERSPPRTKQKQLDMIVAAPTTRVSNDDSNVERRQDRSAFTRATKIYQSFTQGLDRSSLMTVSGELSQSRRRENEEKIDEAEKARILNIIEQEESSDEDEDTSDDESAIEQTSRDFAAAPNEKRDDDNDSLCSETDLLNRSLDSSDKVCEETACNPANYLRYVSDKFSSNLDVLQIVDKNERSFKQVAEKMIQQTRQLEAPAELTGGTGKVARKLMQMKLFRTISDRFFGENEVAQGVPYAIAAVEDFIAVGSSDGSIHLFDLSEQEITVLADKKIKQSPVTCLDIQRLGPNKHIHIVAGHMKGQVVLYKIEGLLTQQEFIARQNTSNLLLKAQDNFFGNVRVKHCKTISDKHSTTISSIKFVGDFTEQVQVISGDVSGLVQWSEFKSNLLGFSVTVICLMTNRLGATFSLAPLIQSQWHSRIDANQTYLDVMQRLDGNIYKTESEKQMLAQELAKQQNAQIVGFGSLDEVYVAQIKPRGVALLSIPRPPYIQAGTVPYLDWGFALTPSYRDKSYPVMAIAWGRTIQLAVYVNRDDANQDIEAPRLELDGFYICDATSIDQCFFLSESLLLILVNRRDVRILYTQNFTPGCFSPSYRAQDAKGREETEIDEGQNAESADLAQVLDFTRIKTQYAGEVSSYAEKDRGYQLMEDEIRHKDNNSYMSENAIRSKFNFSATVCKNYDFNVIALGKQTIGQRNLIHWEEYLDMVRLADPDDWLKVLRAALEIYRGKVVGLAGLPDQNEKRAVVLRESMKELLKDNIKLCIRQFQEGVDVSRATLRVVAEFCIQIGAIDHLFNQLFPMFAEAGLEQKFFQNLDAFILSGKLKEARIPEYILQRIIDYYRLADVELLEKAILNLDLSCYSRALQVRHICEEEYLSSALIHLLTTLFDDEHSNDASACISILCSLFNLMMRNQTIKSHDEVIKLPYYIERQGTSMFETQALLNQSQEHMQSREARLNIEHSRTYISYKLLWVTSLFIEGKKFPTGNLSSFKWRCYVYDIVRFLTNEKFMGYFLEFDPHSFFMVVRRLFLDEAPYEYIKSQANFIEMYRDTVAGLEEPCMNHAEIIECLDTNVRRLISADIEASAQKKLSEKGEALKNSFIFFVAAVSRKVNVTISEELCVRTVSELILFHRKLLDLPKEQLKSLIPDTQEARKSKDRTYNIYLYLIKKNELKILGLLRRYQHQLPMKTLEQISAEADHAPLFKLRVLLWQLQGDFHKCLNMFFQIRSIRTEVFLWLDKVAASCGRGDAPPQTKSNNTGADIEDEGFEFVELRLGQSNEQTLTKLKQVILAHISEFVEMDAVQSVKLCERWLDSDYNKVAKALKEQKDLAFNFMSIVIEQNEEQMIYECENSGTLAGYRPSPRFTELLLQFVDILCSKRFKGKIVDFVSRSYFPIDESLKICEEKGALEASAVLCKRNQEYFKAIELYRQVLIEVGSDISSTLFDEVLQDMDKSNEHILKFDELLQAIIKICDKQSSKLTTNKDQEALWKHALKSLFSIKEEVCAKHRASDSDSMSSAQDSEERANFERFLSTRNQRMIQHMSEYVHLYQIVSFLEDEGHVMEFKEFKQTFQDKFQQESYTEAILVNAMTLNTRDTQDNSRALHAHYGQGVVVNRGNRCDGCNLRFNTQNRQELWMFKCDHVFHTSCVIQSQGQCAVCFNEQQAVQSILSSKTQSMGNALKRAQRRSGKGRRPGGANSASTEAQSPTIPVLDADEQERQRKKEQLRASKEFTESQSQNFERRDERQVRLMTLFERSWLSQEKLELTDFISK